MPDLTKKDGVVQFQLNMRALEILYRYALDGSRTVFAFDSDAQAIARFLEGAEKILVGSGYLTELEVRRFRLGPHFGLKP